MGWLQSGFIWNFPLFIIILCLFSGVLCIALPDQTARRYTLILEGVLMAMTAVVLAFTLRTGEAFTYKMGEFPAPWGNELRIGVLEALMALFFLLIMFCSVLSSSRFLTTDLNKNRQHLYFSLVNLMTAAIMAIFWTNDIFTGYVFLEILTLTSCGVLIVREIGRTTLAAMRYLILNLMGSGLFLLGVVLMYDTTGHLLMVPMRQAVTQLASDPVSLQVISISTGILTIGLSIKSGLFPFHFWMPDTYGAATPVSASLLSSLVSKAYVFLLIKIYYRVIGLEVYRQLPLGKVLFILGICGMIFGSVSALRSTDINRMTAFSSAAQIGYIYMGIGLGTTEGFAAALFHMLVHAVTKSQLFLTTPRLAEVSGNSLRFKQLQGSGLRNKWAGAFFMVGAFSMIGVPFFAGFMSKVMFGIAAVNCNSVKKMIPVLLALSISSLLNAMYFIRTLIRIYTVPARENGGTAAGGRFETVYIVPMLVLSGLNIFLGLFSQVVIDLIHSGIGMFV